MGVVRQTLGPLFRALPLRLRREIRTKRLESIVKRGKFVSDEHEFSRLREWLAPGDVAIDIGANLGTYTMRMSELVGGAGRVYAFEPVPQTFATLTRLLSVADCTNVTALNLACSDRNAIFVNLRTRRRGYRRRPISRHHHGRRTIACFDLLRSTRRHGAPAGPAPTREDRH